ncbi:hypothetical protein Adu01nite_32160 [Paractinoplanes durhamensis]|uniref:Uncharacterized protein n=1 Tax=Paractinoplanes durhamensis TaxID=113563 RepID=A0ABQ3YWE2_9ACTN|nr:hypothetical protein Adu01nite_32160 [Actinoplanes durhamensis]
MAVPDGRRDVAGQARGTGKNARRYRYRRPFGQFLLRNRAEMSGAAVIAALRVVDINELLLPAVIQSVADPLREGPLLT